MWDTARLCDPPTSSTLDILPSSLPLHPCARYPYLVTYVLCYDVINHSPLLPVVLLFHFKPTLETLYSCWDFRWSVELRCPWCGYNIHVMCCASFSSTFFSVLETRSHMCCWLIAVLLHRLNQVWEVCDQSFQSKIQIWHLFLTVFLDLTWAMSKFKDVFFLVHRCCSLLYSYTCGFYTVYIISQDTKSLLFVLIRCYNSKKRFHDSVSEEKTSVLSLHGIDISLHWWKKYLIVRWLWDIFQASTRKATQSARALY